MKGGTKWKTIKLLGKYPIKDVKDFDNSRIRTEKSDMVPLMEDIKHRGLLQPIGVLENNGNYIVRFGNRRLVSM